MLQSRSRRKTTTIEAIALHEAVSPDKWCVTYADLRYLRQQVISAIQQGLILSSPSSYGDDESKKSEDDDEFGPSIYVVNEQYIKPITAQAGKMSWALMMNPDGLDCHLFVSHAWQEGIFEFLSKVLGSWPSRAKHAWCCMLANPQNLNVGSMLQSPKTSPFALALQASRYVLVVPNRHQSVYCRLWCGYEAYVASEKAKIIQIATPPKIRRMMISWVMALVPISLGFLLGFFGALWKWDARAGVIVISLCILTSANTTRTCCQLSNYTGLIFSCCMAICWVSFPKASLHFLDFTPHTTKIYQAILWTCCIAFFLIAEMDRIRSDEIAKEGQQLRKHYEGTIRMAGCSQPSDMQNIWEEIGDKVHKVDTAINVLISAGLSSPSLRLAAESGVNIKGAGHAEVAIPFVFLGPQLVVGFSQVVILIMNGAHHSNWASVILEGIAVVARLVFMWLLCRRPADEICFMLKVLTKLVGAVFFPTVLTVGVLVGLHYETAAKTMSIATFMCFNMALILAVVFACLGITGTLSLPGGRCLVQIFLQRGAWCPSRASTRSMSTSESDSGTDTEDSDGSN